jgi:outer membrane protein assembly factor BamD (BamD/ComL family)
MKKIEQIVVVLALAAVLFSACQSKKEKLNAQIAQAEKQVAESYSEESMTQLVALYQEYAKTYPDDSLAVEYLFNSANFNMRLQKGQEALADLDAIIKKYPNSWRVPDCYFSKGFVYEDVLYDIESAKNAYYDFVGRYPSHKLALDASLAISYLEMGKTPEEIVAGFTDSIAENQE